jgi:hypothetical protein
MIFEDCCLYDAVGGTGCYYYFWCYTNGDTSGCPRVTTLLADFYDYNLND